MDASRVGSRASAAPLTDSGLRFRRMERRGRGSDDGADGRRRRAGRRADRADRSRGVLRLPGEPAERSGSPRVRPARSSGPATCCYAARARRAPSATSSCSTGTEPNLRWRTFSEGIAGAAESLGVEMVVTLGALIADVAHSSAGADHRPRLGRGAGRAARPDALELRGPDRHRRRPPRRLPPPRHPLGQPLGRRPPLRRRGAQPQGRPRAAAAPGGPRRRRRRGLRARGGGRAPTSSQVSRTPSPPTPRSRSWSSASRRSRRSSSSSRTTFPPARPWPKTSSGSSASSGPGPDA